MQQTDFERFRDLMAGMGRIFGSSPDQLLLDVYWLALRDWSLADFEAATAHLLSKAQFMPKPADYAALRKAGQPTSGEAFERARQIVRRLFPREYASHQSGDARLDAAVRACGGYEALAMCTSENIGFFERRFAEHFESISDAETVREVLPDLTGGMRLSGPQGASIALRRIGRA
jgi:hypothetical protein